MVTENEIQINDIMKTVILFIVILICGVVKSKSDNIKEALKLLYKDKNNNDGIVVNINRKSNLEEQTEFVKGNDAIDSEENFEENIKNSDLTGYNELTETCKNEDCINLEEPSINEDTTNNVDISTEDSTPLMSSASHKNNLLIVSTLDGEMTAIDYNCGKILWSHVIGTYQSSLISSSLSKLDITTNGQWMRLIPSLDGAIYKFDGENITPLPVNADILLHSSYKFNEETVVTGGKVTEIIGIDPDTGQVKYSCSKDGCERSQTMPDTPLIVITKESKIVRAVDLNTGDERWNFSVGQHFLQVVRSGWAQFDEDFDNEIKNVHFVVPEGLLNAEGNHGLIWSQKLSSPIVSVWKISEKEVKQLDLFSNTSVPALIPKSNTTSPDKGSVASLYIGLHKNEFYVQESLSFKNKVIAYSKDLPINNYPDNLPVIKWRPHLATAVSMLPVESCNNKDVDTVTVSSETKEYDDGYNILLAQNGVYLFYEEDDISKRWPFSFLHKHSESFDDICLLNHIDLIFDKNNFLNRSSLLVLWLIGCLSCTCTCFWFRFGIIKNLMKQVISYFFNKMFKLLHRAGVDLNVPVNKSSSNEQSVISSGYISESNDRRISEIFDTTGPCFTSRLCSEFTAVECLGKGGFGYVFNAQHKVDATNYAIKRIKLPTRRESSKMMREVYALAKLQHPHIVRYFSSWIETPPVGWQSPFDILLKKEDGSMDPDNWEDSETISLAGQSSLTVGGDSTISNITFANSQSTSVCGNNKSSSSESSDYDRFNSNFDKYDDSSSIVFEGTSGGEINSENISMSEHISTTKSKVTAESEPIERRCREKSENENQRTYLYIQMELCVQATLRDWLEDAVNRDMSKILHTFNNVVHAVEYIHDQNLIHRDLKPSNIFFSNDGNVKVGDFGLVTTIVDEVSQKMTKESVLMSKRTLQAGTELYMSPEQKERRRYNHKVDIFSLGIIFYEMLVPFGTEMERKLTLMKVRRREFSDNFEKQFPQECLLLNQMLNENADMRPTTRGLRSLQPLSNLQTDLHLIEEKEHNVLKTHRKRLNSSKEHILI